VIGLSEAVIDCGDGAHDRRCHDSQVSAPPDTVGPVLERSQRVVLRKLRLEDEQAYLTMVAASRSLHHPWTSPPGDQAGFRALMERGAVGDFVSLAGWRADDNTLVAIVNLSQIARGGFQSCYCGFYANAATAGQGLTREALELSLHYAFSREGLHRLEVNIQPNNTASLALVRRIGFRHEGFSRRYLHVDGAWRDHERFAITADEWRSVEE
jgi:ribosomal-protein-alanine N-acetyltransferase